MRTDYDATSTPPSRAALAAERLAAPPELSDELLAPEPRREPARSPTGEPVPVTLLTGFLGSGKTTLLNHLLTGEHGLRVGVLVNDFGVVSIDAELVADVGEQTITMANGCVCCEVRDDLVTALETLLARDERVDYVILEASGVADPSGIVATFLDERYAELFRLDSITCVVDAATVWAAKDAPEVVMLKLRQVGLADLVILNKVDLVSPDHARRVRRWLEGLLDRVRVVEARHATVPYEILLGAGRFDPARADEVALTGEPVAVATTTLLEALPAEGAPLGPSAADGSEAAGPEAAGLPLGVATGAGTSATGTPVAAGRAFTSWYYTNDEPLSESALLDVVRRLPGTVYRCKGFVLSAERPKERLVLQGVGRRGSLTSLGGWRGRPPRTELVVIMAAQAPGTRRLRRQLDDCRATGGELAKGS